MQRRDQFFGRGGALLAATLAALAIAPVCIGEPAAGLTVEAQGLRSERGQVLCFLYAGPAGFPADPQRAVAKVAAPIAQGAATCRFGAVAPGAYAVAVVHDENGNGRLDRNLVGIPSEGVGASMNPVTHFGPPTFEQARFVHAGAKTLTVQIHYL
jgi:uncharacterized protein (DUF2141 family)